MVLFAIGARLGIVSIRELGPLIDSGPSSPFDISKDAADNNAQLTAVATKTLKHLVETMSADSFDTSSFGKKNPFTLAWLLSFAGGIDLHSGRFGEMSAELKKKDFLKHLADWTAVAVKRLQSLTSSKPELLEIPDNKGHAAVHSFPALRCVQLYLLAKRICEGRPNIPLLAKQPGIKKTADSNQQVIRAAGEWFLSRMLDHLAYASIKDAPFDAAELAFSLEGYLLCEDGRNHDPEVVGKVFSVMAERQEINPYWRPLKPLITDNRGFALLPLSVELMNSLFRTCWLLKTSGAEVFSRHVNIFHRYYEWIVGRSTHGEFKDSNGTPKEFTGWHSEHVLQPGSIHIWETSQVAIYLLFYREMLQKHTARRALQAAHLSVRAIPRKKKAHAILSAFDYWHDVVTKNDPKPSERRLHADICTHFIECRSPSHSGRQSYSMVLYGPPGTGKTSIAENIAAALGWKFIEITPSDFVASGESAVELRAGEIFSALAEQEDAVILFDEIDRLILDRDAPIYQQQGDMFQVMTPGMLPKLKQLRSRQRCIFILATNYKERLDPAAIRIGRIDKHFLVSLPNAAARAEILAKEIFEELRMANVGIVKEAASGQISARSPLTAEELAVPAGHCVLGAYGEMCELARDAIIEVHRKIRQHGGKSVVCSKDLIEIVNRQASEFTAAVRLDSYRSRFKVFIKPGETLPTKEEPFIEFLDLAGLACENEATRSKLTKNGRDTIFRVVKGACEHSNVEPDGVDANSPTGLIQMIARLRATPEFREVEAALGFVADALQDGGKWVYEQ